MFWPWRRRPQEDTDEAVPPGGDGWRRWFEVSQRAAEEPPWHYDRVEIWRSNWDRPRITRTADLPYQHDGPQFWWRPLPHDLAIAEAAPPVKSLPRRRS